MEASSTKTRASPRTTVSSLPMSTTSVGKPSRPCSHHRSGGNGTSGGSGAVGRQPVAGSGCIGGDGERENRVAERSGCDHHAQIERPSRPEIASTKTTAPVADPFESEAPGRTEAAKRSRTPSPSTSGPATTR